MLVTFQNETIQIDAAIMLGEKMERKSLAWFLGITFLISWPLFLVPLLFQEMDPTNKQLMTKGLWAVAMWGPGIAAIFTTVFIAKQPFKNLRLNTLGPKRYYLWAWLLPIGLTLIAGLITLVFGIAKLDLNFSMIRNAMASAANGNSISAEKSRCYSSFICTHSRAFHQYAFCTWRRTRLARIPASTSYAAWSMESDSHQRHHLGSMACTRNRTGT